MKREPWDDMILDSHIHGDDQETGLLQFYDEGIKHPQISEMNVGVLYRFIQKASEGEKKYLTGYLKYRSALILLHFLSQEKLNDFSTLDQNKSGSENRGRLEKDAEKILASIGFNSLSYGDQNFALFLRSCDTEDQFISILGDLDNINRLTKQEFLDHISHLSIDHMGSSFRKALFAANTDNEGYEDELIDVVLEKLHDSIVELKRYLFEFKDIKILRRSVAKQARDILGR